MKNSLAEMDKPVQVYLKRQFYKDWHAHGIYHMSVHVHGTEKDEVTCFITWLESGKPTIRGNKQEAA